MDTDSIGRLYAEYHNEALLYVLALCRNETLAEDIVANAFFKALLHKDDSIRQFKSWLFAVCKNEFLSCCRKQKRIDPAALSDKMADDQPSVLDTIIRSEDYRALYRAISLLSDDQREAIVLFYYSRLPIRDIAGITGKSESNVKVLLHRARQTLKQLLEETR